MALILPGSSSTSSGALRDAKSGSVDAWHRLVDTYGPLVDFWCRRNGINEHDSADVVQEVFKAVHRSLSTFRHDRQGDTFRGWLLTIARNKIRDFWQRNNSVPGAVGGSSHDAELAQLPDDMSASSFDDPLDNIRWPLAEALAMVQASFENKTWEAFWRTAVENEPTKDVAADLGMTQVAVRKAKSRVLRKLREELHELFEE